jgi:hypothetical protein
MGMQLGCNGDCREENYSKTLIIVVAEVQTKYFLSTNQAVVRAGSSPSVCPEMKVSGKFFKL